MNSNDLKAESEHNFRTRGRTTSIEKFLTAVFLTLIVFAGWGYRFPDRDHSDLASQVLALSDGELYSQDFFIHEMSGFTPRIYHSYAVFGFMCLGLDLASAYFMVYAIGVVLLVTGLLAIADEIRLSHVSTGLLIFVALIIRWGDIGTGNLTRPAAVPSILAASFAIWGVRFCFQRRWTTAYCLFGVACLFQVLVGALPALLVGPMLLFDSWRNHKTKNVLLAAMGLGIGAGLVYIPMRLTGGTDSGLMTGDQFVHIYGHIRVPHMVVPTAWPVDEWRHFIVFFASSTYLIVRSKVLSQTRRIGLLSVIGMMGILLLVNYLFVEVWPVPLIAKLQFSRTTPFGELAALIGLVAVFDGHLRRKQWVACAALLTCFTFARGVYLLAGFAMARDATIWLSRRYPIQRNRGLVTLGAVSLLYAPLLPLLLVPQIVRNWARQFYCKNRAYSTRIRFVTLACGIAGAGGYIFLGLSDTLPASGQHQFDNRIAFNQGLFPEEEVTELAKRFESQSPIDSLILVPPNIEQFRLYSKRSVLVDNLSFPFTDRGILQWKQRMEDVLGTPLKPGTLSLINELYRQRSAIDLTNVASHYHCQYILSRRSWHPDMPGEVVDQQGDWAIWCIGSTEARE